MISAVLVNLNEANKLEKCFKNLAGFVDEIVVLDLGSSDQSLDLCNKYGANVFRHPFVSFVEKVRNLAVSKARGEWVLVLDPDEIISDGLKDKLKQVSLENEYTAVNIPRKNIFFGRWIAHTNWWPDKHVRFFKKGNVEWNDKIHQYPKITGRVLDLEAKTNLAIIHFGYDSIAEFIDRQNRYSTIEAENLIANGVKFSKLNLVWKPIREFLVRYIRHIGFLDGFVGFALTFLMMMYQLQVMVKMWELERQK